MKQRTSLALVGGLIGAATAIATPQPSGFDWSSITPSRKLEFHPCYDEHKCARLLVPLDWLDDANPHTVALAIVKLPARVPASDPAFGGTIFTNPGGPGGSGVNNLLREGHVYQDTADTDTRKYEIMSWDPRGVQFTSPKADCYDDLFARGTDAIQRMALGPIGASPDALRRHWARVHGYARLCSESAVNASIIPFASTASVARDMVEMLDRIQELREAEAETAQGVYAGEDSQKPMKARGVKKPLRLQYWGFSYGSALGNTFASMFPGRVGRMIVDGIVDIDDYMAGGWLTNLQDTEELVDYFYKTCFDAGPDKCALARPSDATSHDVRARVDDLVRRLDADPIHVLDGKLTHILTGYDAVNAFTRPLYSPYDSFPPLARRLDDAVRGNYTSLLAATTESLPRLDQACAHPNATAPPSSLGDGGQAVLCGDGEDATDMSMEDYRAYAATLEGQSPTFAGYWSQIRLACTGWGVRPRWRYAGPFGTPAHDAAGAEGKPAAPLLFLSSRLDPVTPLRNARRMSEAHAGSVVVVQESVGHCSIATGSRCMTGVIRRYLEHGEVPAEETVCEADCGPWDGDTCLPSTRGVGVAGLGPPHEVHAW